MSRFAVDQREVWFYTYFCHLTEILSSSYTAVQICDIDLLQGLLSNTFAYWPQNEFVP